MSFTLEEMTALLATASEDSELAQLGRRYGVEVLSDILNTLGGTRGCEMYVPSAKNFFRKLARDARDKEICNRHTGTNTSQLAMEYDLNPSRIRQIVASQKVAREVC